jgi:hypothetical protein
MRTGNGERRRIHDRCYGWIVGYSNFDECSPPKSARGARQDEMATPIALNGIIPSNSAIAWTAANWLN